MRTHRSSFRGRVTDQIRVSEGHLSLSPLHLLNCRHFESIIFRCSRNYSGRLNVILRSMFGASVVAVRVKRGEEGWLGPAPVGAEGRPSERNMVQRSKQGAWSIPCGERGDPGVQIRRADCLWVSPSSTSVSSSAPPEQLYTQYSCTPQYSSTLAAGRVH